MAPILRGEVRWAELESQDQVVGHEQGNTRPVLILSRDQFNHHTQLVIAALITRNGAGKRGAVPIQSISMRSPSWVLSGQVRTLSTKRIGGLIGTLSADEVGQVLTALFLTLTP